LETEKKDRAKPRPDHELVLERLCNTRTLQQVADELPRLDPMAARLFHEALGKAIERSSERPTPRFSPRDGAVL